MYIYILLQNAIVFYLFHYYILDAACLDINLHVLLTIFSCATMAEVLNDAVSPLAPYQEHKRTFLHKPMGKFMDELVQVI